LSEVSQARTVNYIRQLKGSALFKLGAIPVLAALVSLSLYRVFGPIQVFRILKRAQ